VNILGIVMLVECLREEDKKGMRKGEQRRKIC
jgi:hypothetical protein